VGDVATKKLLQCTTDFEKFSQKVHKGVKLLPYESVEATLSNASKITSWLSGTIDECTQEIERKPQSVWWHPGLGVLKACYTRKMAKVRRCSHSDMKETLRGEAKVAKKKYAQAIYQPKEDAWKGFITQYTAWGRPYKAIVKKKDGYGVPPGLVTPEGPTESKGESEEYLLRVKFPSLDIDIPEPPVVRAMSDEDKEEMERGPVTGEEIGLSLKKRNNRSAPGSGVIRWKHLKEMHKKRPEILTDLMNVCLRFSVFSVEWKEASVSFIPKGANLQVRRAPIGLFRY